MPVAVPLSARSDTERRGRAPVEAAASGARPPPTPVTEPLTHPRGRR